VIGYIIQKKTTLRGGKKILAGRIHDFDELREANGEFAIEFEGAGSSRGGGHGTNWGGLVIEG